ncbi:DUF2935 domain-containing protein [Peribacillus saganii]|uniref:DUF2935 domain-containing protein n=1 Tax=Peribacillus saganii TaxID=2303992 RepID=A0A372LKR4_9BACI|nr:DUF2935 domain-containing protein [Peribacillus saganii]RFU67347.1 DUF2935 domain-containing protein [Peribacillus saganii]
MKKDFREEALFELRFWMQILGDHSRFIHDSLAPSEKRYIERSSQFILKFDQLLDAARKPLEDHNLLSLLLLAQTEAEAIRELKLSIIKDHLVGEVKIGLSPSFLNHMVNEVEEALRLLSFLVRGHQLPSVHPLHHDLLWLLDAAGHAGAIANELDTVEKKLKRQARQFSKDWEEFYLKSIELTGFLRTKTAEFPALSKFHHDVELEMAVFQHFLQELEEMELRKETLGTLTPLMADHMAREECYYLTKLAESAAVKQPDCDPSKPRTPS